MNSLRDQAKSWVPKAVVNGVDPGDITTIEDEGFVEEAHNALAEMKAAMA